MRQQIKFSLFFLSIGFLFLLSSCEKDLYDEPAYQEKYKLEKIPISKLLKNEKFKKTFYKTFKTDYQSKFFVNKGIFNRETEGYIITDSVANVASFENNISYNFKIEYPSKPTSDTIFNLVVYEDELGNAENYITKNLEINQILTPVEITDSNDVSKTVLLDCISFHSSPRYFDEYTLGIDWDCVDSYNNTGGGGTGSGNGGTGSGTGGMGSGTGSGSGTGAGSNSGGPILTSPVGGNPNGNSTTTPPTPCETLEKAKSDTKVQTAIDFLKTKTSGKQEFAYGIDRAKTLFDDTEGFVNEYSTTFYTGSNYTINVKTGTSTQGQAHNHPINGLSIPSWDDIYWTQQCEENNSVNNNNTAFNIIVAADPDNAGEHVLYAITINNLATLQQATSADFAHPKVVKKVTNKEKQDEIMNNFEEKFSNVPDNSNALETKFLNIFANYGINLHKFNDATGKWEKLKLNPNNSNEVEVEPCN